MSERDWAEIERLRQQVLALENDGMETAARLGEAEGERDHYREALEIIADARQWLSVVGKTPGEIAREALDA